MKAIEQIIENAARAIVDLDRRAIANGEDAPSPGEILNHLHWAAYALNTAQLASAFRMAAEMQDLEADALEQEGAASAP